MPVIPHAGVAHPVERHLAKVEVASSSLVARSRKQTEISCEYTAAALSMQRVNATVANC